MTVARQGRSPAAVARGGRVFTASSWPAFADAMRAAAVAARAGVALDPARNARAHGMTPERYLALQRRFGVWAMAFKRGVAAPAPITAEEAAFLRAHVAELGAEAGRSSGGTALE